MDKHILVVDDDEVVLGAVCKALRPDKYAIDTAQSADEALKLLLESSYRVVITDLMMPGMDGLELLQRIHDMGAKSESIMITGYPTIQTALRAKRLGAFEYVTKPFTRQELRSVVVRGLRRVGGGDAGAGSGRSRICAAGLLHPRTLLGPGGAGRQRHYRDGTGIRFSRGAG